MAKKIVAFMLSMVMLLSMAACGGKSSSGLQFEDYDGKSYWVRIGTCTDTDVVIPSKYQGRPVTGICPLAFQDCTSLASITIPDSVTSIGDGAFSGCTSLTSISIPDSVTSIGDGAFSGCTSLTSITIPKSVTSIGNSVFYCEKYYAAESIPDDATIYREILKDCYEVLIGCNSLTSITVSEDNAVYCSVDGVLFNKEMTELVCYPAGKADISYVIPDTVTSIDECAFAGCNNLTSITIPDSVTSMGERAFSGCTGLTSITIPDSVSSIGDYAFYYCTGLTSVTIGTGLTSIDEYAFRYCSSLKKINFGGTKAQWNDISKHMSWDSNTGKYAVYCTDGTVYK